MKNKYNFYKKIYPNYLLLFQVKDKYKTCYVDSKLLEDNNKNGIIDLENKKINYIIIDNMDIIIVKSFENNKYYHYILKMKLHDLIKEKIKYEKKSSS